MDRETARIEDLRKRYPQGTRVYLESMEGEPQMPSGLMGVVDGVDDIGQIFVDWENGSALALQPGLDRFHKVPAVTKDHQPRAGEEPSR